MALAATVLGFCWQAFQTYTLYQGNWSGLFRTSSYPSVPASLVGSTWVLPPGQGYDGQFYRYVAHEPWPPFRHAASTDMPQLRYQRILIPALAWILALGRHNLIDFTFILIVDAAVFLGVFYSCRYFQFLDRDPRWGLLFLLMPATIASIDRMLTDGAQLACFAAALALAQRRAWRWLWLVCMLAGLTRETGLFLPAGFALAALFERRWLRAFAFASAALPTFAWMAFLQNYFPPLPVNPGFGFLFTGILSRLLHPAPYPEPALRLILHVLDVLAFTGFGVSVVLAALRVVRNWPVAPAVVVAFFVSLALAFGADSPMYDPLAFSRPLSPLFFYLTIEAISDRVWWWLVSPLAISLTLLAYDAKALLTALRFIKAA